MYVKKISHIAEIRVSSEYHQSTIKTETIILTRIFASSIFIESHLTTKYACQIEMDLTCTDINIHKDIMLVALA